MKYNKILVIDNDWEDIEIFRQAVMAVSPVIRCTFTADAEGALRDLQRGTLFPKAIFLDIEMETLNGHEFLKLAKADSKIKDIPIFMISTHSDTTIKSQSISSGAAGFITKPSNFTELVESLKAILL